MWKFRTHLTLALILRLILIVYGEIQDRISEVPYTDIDYRVFTDAARYVHNFQSPYNRHTYRYTPLIAYLLIPNLLIHNCFGKVLFSLIDLLIGSLLKSIIAYNRSKYLKHIDSDGKKYLKNSESESEPERIADYCAFVWIYNPFTILITTRGNCDSVAIGSVLLTLYLLQCRSKYFLAGLIHGFAIHLRLYPIVYSLSFYMYLSPFGSYSTPERVNKTERVNWNRKKTVFKSAYLLYLLPNWNQIKLISGCFLSLSLIITFFYHLYGYDFLYETYIYHFIRKDTRHNFSLFFYIQYLTSDIKNVGLWSKILTTLPQLILLLVLSVRYGLNRFTLPFSLLTQTFVIVAYNSVLTSQYFVWILGVLPLTLWQLNLTKRTAVKWLLIWIVTQLAWLFPAYLLEFRGQNTFFFIWLQSVSFFCTNIAILGRLIKCYMNI